MAGRAIAWLVGSALATAACGRSAPELADLPERGGAGDSSGRGGSSGSAGLGGTGTGGTAGTSDTGGTTGTGGDPCEGEPPLAAQRIVRLSFDQIAVSLRQLLNPTVAEEVVRVHELPTFVTRTFPPLQNPREGSLVTDSVFQLGDSIAQTAAKYVFNNFQVVTGCLGPPTETCGRGFVMEFAERAFRRPLTADEWVNLDAVYSDATMFGGSVEQATQHGVYAVLVSPHFLYRTELGARGDPAPNATLNLYEVASLLSYFLTNGPPDAQLLASAADGSLLEEGVLMNQVTRLLAIPDARANLETALLTYLGIYALPGLVIDPSVADTRVLGPGMRNSMVHEAELFFEDHLWDGAISDLLISRRGRVNSTLAPVYGPEIQATAGSNPDMFTELTLPAERAGLLTMPGFLTAHVRPEASAVTGRGLLVNALIACRANPPEHPPNSSPAPAPGVSQREAADARARDAVCVGCHGLFDGFGLALERFDSIGRYRTIDAEGRRIEEAVSIPFSIEPVSGATGLADVLSQHHVWGACLTQTLLRFALAEPTASDVGNSCAAREIVQAHADSDGSFSSLVREIARSRAFVMRSPGDL